MKTNRLTLLLLAVASFGYKADASAEILSKTSAQRRANHDAVKALSEKATNDKGEIVQEIVLQINALELQDESLAQFEKSLLKRAELEKTPATERFNVLFGDSGHKELDNFSLATAMRAAMHGTNEGQTAELNSIARDEFRQAQANVLVSSDTIAIPRALLEKKMQNAARRYYNATQSVTGSNLGSQFVQTDVASFFGKSSLLPVPMLQAAGAFMVTGLTGNLDIPLIAPPSPAAAVVAENANATAVDSATSKLSLTPKRLPVYMDVSDQLVMQSSPDIEALLLMLLMERVNVSKDAICFTNLAGQSGIGAVVGGTNGLAPTEVHLIDLETAVANANAMGSRYIVNTRTRAFYKKLAVVSGQPERVWRPDNTLNGYPALVTNNVTNTAVKGSSGSVCSHIWFGDWSKYIMASWGGVLVQKTQDKAGAIAGTGTLVVTEFFDGGAIAPYAFALMADALAG